MRLATAAALVYVAGVVIFMVCGGQRLLPSEYHGVGMIAVVWTIVLAATATRTVPATALQAMARFRTLFAQGMIAAIVSALACLGLGIALRAPGCVAGVAIGEALLAILLWRQLHVQGGARSQALDGEGGKSRAETALG